MESRRSLVLITADCLRADHCGFLGYDRPTTPFLDALATQSWTFTNAIVAGVPTYYSLPSILASRYPLALGRDVAGLSSDEPALASTLRDAGYTTACFSAANPYLSKQFGYGHGFDTFCDFLHAEVDTLPRPSPPVEGGNKLRSGANQRLAQMCRQLGLGSVYDELYFQYCQRISARPVRSLDSLRPFPSADMIVDHAQAWLASRAQGPFFLWLHLMDPHSPYYAMQQSLEMMGNANLTPGRARYVNGYWNRQDLASSKLRRQRETVVNLYDAGIRWVDEQVKRLVEILRQFELWDNCSLAFTADHGEEFLEHGGRYHAPSKLTQELVHVPLLLRIPGEQPRILNSPFSLLHLAPTVLDALRIQVPSAFQGGSYCRQIDLDGNWDTPALTECVSDCKNPFLLENRMGPRLLAVLEGRYKLVIDFNTGEERLFDLEADPDECSPVPRDTAVQTRRRLLEIAHAHIESSLRARNSRLRIGMLLQDVKRTITSRLYVDDCRTNVSPQRYLG